MEIVAYILAWSAFAAGLTYGVRLVLLESGKDRFARGVYRDKTSRF